MSVSGAGQEMGGCRHGVGAGSPQAVWGRAGGRAAQGLRQKAGDDDAFWAVSPVCPLVILGRSWPAWRCMTQPCQWDRRDHPAALAHLAAVPPLLPLLLFFSSFLILLQCET